MTGAAITGRAKTGRTETGGAIAGGAIAGSVTATSTRLPPVPWHRGLTIIAIISMFIGTRGLWTRAVTASNPVTAVIVAGYAAILALALLALTARHRRALRLVDLGTLILGITLVACAYVIGHTPTDEGALTAQAAQELLRGHHVYGQPWPWIFAQSHVALTQTMSGGADYTYGYPPLAVLLTAALHLVVPGATLGAAASGVPTIALVAGTITLWVLLPVPWRPAATAVCLGFGLLPTYARHGYPAIIATALLVPVIVRWHRIGAGGRLSRSDIAGAICLGAACATQQLAWFLVPFLFIGVYALRRGETRPAVPSRSTPSRIVARYTAVAAATWLAINAFFLVREPAAWFAGILTPMTQHAVPHGQGLIDISYYFTGGSGSLDFYSYATLAFGAAVLILFTLFINRLGPAAIVLPWCIFFLAIRSQDGYFLLMTPLWLAAAATVPVAAFAGAWQPVTGRFRHPAVRVATAALLLSPTAVCIAIAAGTPPPLDLVVTGARTAKSGLVTLDVRVTNDTANRLTPHFAFSNSEAMHRFWLIRSGPASLAGYATALYEIAPYEIAPYEIAPYEIAAPRTGQPATGVVRGPHGYLQLRVVTDSPMTITSTTVPRSDLP